MNLSEKNQAEYEAWKPVVGYDGYFSVSNTGRIRSENRTILGSRGFEVRRKGKEQRQYTHKNGYRRVCFWRHGKRMNYSVRRPVAEVKQVSATIECPCCATLTGFVVFLEAKRIEA